MEIHNIADHDANRDSEIQRVCSLFVDLPIHFEGGIIKHFLSSANIPILRCSVPRESMMVDDVAHFWWENKKSKGPPLGTSQEAKIVSALIADLQYAPDCRDENRQDDEVQ